MFQQRGRFCLSTPIELLTHLSQEEPFDLSQKPPGLRLSQSDGESVPGSSCQEEDEDSLYRRSQYSPEVDQQEPAGEEQYMPELEESGQHCPGGLRPGETEKQHRSQQSLEEQIYEEQTAAKEQSVHPSSNQEHRSQSETSCESDAELDAQVYHPKTSRRQSSDSLSDYQPELDESEQSKLQFDGTYEAVDVAETE